MAHLEPIDDPLDPRLACYADLKWRAKPKPETDWFIAEGRLCVRRLLESRYQVRSVLVERGKESEVVSCVDARQTGPAGFGEAITIYSMTADRIQTLVGYDFHRGIMACGVRPSLRPAIASRVAETTPPLSLAAIGVSEQENLGSMMRTAAALGIETIMLGPQSADPFSRRTIRVSMATVLQLSLCSLRNPVADLRELERKGGVRTVVTTLSPDATPLDQFQADGRACVLVMGSEATGIDREIEDLATDRVTIPMQLGTDSLNVSVAAAIFMYELAARHR